MNIQKKVAAAGAFVMFMVPLLVLGQETGSGLIPCVGVAGPGGNACDFNSLIVLANNIIKFLLYKVSVPLVAVGAMYAGAKLILADNKESAWTEAKGRFADIGTGFGIMLGAYVLIKVVLFAFLTEKQVTFMGFLLQ